MVASLSDGFTMAEGVSSGVKLALPPHGAGALNQVRDLCRGVLSSCKERCIGSYDVTPLAKVDIVRELPVWNHIR